MSVPKGAIWQELRALALDTIPPGTQNLYSGPSSLSGWQQNGYYIVKASSNSQYTVITAGADFGSALLGDAEYFLDHAAEHQASIWKTLNSAEWISPAWLIVTFYYWAFFLGLSTTRLMGQTPWFIDKKAKHNLTQLSPRGSRTPGAGSFRINCHPFLSLIDREVILKKSDSRIHEDLWKIWFEWCLAMTKKYSSGTGSQLEQRLFATMALSAKKLGADWPSSLRNLVNYRPGLAYDAVRRRQILGRISHLRPPEPKDIEQIIDRLETTVIGSTSNMINTQLETISKALIDFTFVLHRIATDLHRELVDRNGLDKRWLNNRQLFVKEKGLNLAEVAWPC